MNTMTETEHLAEALTLTDVERQRCEVWTRVMGYHRPGRVVQHRQEGRAPRAPVLRRAGLRRRRRPPGRRLTRPESEPAGAELLPTMTEARAVAATAALATVAGAPVPSR